MDHSKSAIENDAIWEDCNYGSNYYYTSPKLHVFRVGLVDGRVVSVSIIGPTWDRNIRRFVLSSRTMKLYCRVGKHMIKRRMLQTISVPPHPMFSPLPTISILLAPPSWRELPAEDVTLLQGRQYPNISSLTFSGKQTLCNGDNQV